MDVMETTGAVTPNGETLWSVETVGAVLKDARDRGLVILGGDVLTKKCGKPGRTGVISRYGRHLIRNFPKQVRKTASAGRRSM